MMAWVRVKENLLSCRLSLLSCHWLGWFFLYPVLIMVIVLYLYTDCVWSFYLLYWLCWSYCLFILIVLIVSSLYTDYVNFLNLLYWLFWYYYVLIMLDLLSCISCWFYHLYIDCIKSMILYTDYADSAILYTDYRNLLSYIILPVNHMHISSLFYFTIIIFTLGAWSL